MSNVPPVVFAAPVIAVVALLVLPRLAKAAMGATDRRYPEFRLPELAHRMGLRIVEGDPSINVMQAHVVHNMASGRPTGGVLRRQLDLAKETRILLEGAPYGRPTRFWFFSRTEQADRIAVKIVRREFDCRLSIHVPVNVPPFEIVLRGARLGAGTKPELGLPRQSFGDPDVDRRLALTCADPRLGPALAPAVAALTSHTALHIQGHDSVIESLVGESTVMLAVERILDTQHALEHMANVLAGPVSQQRRA